ncbi:hypothetical protein [Rhizobium ruizarguesonis]|uniref:hypothetical protein n=1 Tax=Rhizobium ruizarguesonis TaxID=2081791 RepID=UPI001A90297A|nr:hypothetical protein [Rhizobium ruizarguesonis]
MNDLGGGGTGAPQSIKPAENAMPCHGDGVGGQRDRHDRHKQQTEQLCPAITVSNGIEY